MAKSLRDKLKEIDRKVHCLECNDDGGGGIQSIQPGANITVDNTDPKNPVVSSSGGGGGGTGAINVTGPLTGSGLAESPVGILPASSTTRGTMSIAHYNKLENVNFSNYMTTSHPANDITSTNITNWNSAFSWGDHNLMGYITASSNSNLTNKTGNVSMWTNDANYVNSSTLNTTLGNYATTNSVNTGLGLKENTANKVIAWSSTPTDTQFPSAKLVKDSLDSVNNNKLDKTVTTTQSVSGPVIFESTISVPKVLLPVQTSNTTPHAVWGDGSRTNYNGAGGTPKQHAFVSDLPTTFKFTPTGNFTTSQIKTAAENAGLIFNGLHIFIILGTNSYICTVDNGASFPETIITMGLRKTGPAGSISFQSTRTLNAGTENITIMNGNENSMALLNFGTTQDLLTIKNQ